MMCADEVDLTAYLDRELAPARQAEMAEHVQSCADCQRTLATLQQAVLRLAEVPDWEPSAKLRRQVLNAISADPVGAWASLKQKWWMTRVFVPGLAAATALGVAFLVVHRGDRASLLAEPDGIELAANLEVVRDLDVLGVDQPEDVDVVADLDALEAMP